MKFPFQKLKNAFTSNHLRVDEALLVADGSNTARTLSDMLGDHVNVRDFGAKGDGVTDDTVAIQKAIDSVETNGGTVLLPVGVYILTAAISVPSSVVLIGAGWSDTSYGSINKSGALLKQTGAAWAIYLEPGSRQQIRNIGLIGSASALGGIKIGDTGQSNGLCSISNVNIDEFTATGAAAIYVVTSYRCKIDHVYSIRCYTHLKLGSDVTTLTVNKCNFAVNTSESGKALDATSGGTINNVSFDHCYFESFSGQYPIDMRTNGRFRFNNCGFENFTGTTASVSNVAMFYAGSTSRLTINQCEVEWFASSGTDALSGQASAFDVHCVYLANDHFGFRFEDNYVSQGFTITSPGTGVRQYATYKFIRQLGPYSNIYIGPNELTGAGFATNALCDAAYSRMQDPTYTPLGILLAGSNISKAQNGSFIRRDVLLPPLEAEPADTGGAGSKSPTTVTGVASASNLLGRSLTFYVGALGAGRSIKVKAWGRRTGGVGTKQVYVRITCGASITAHNLTAASISGDWSTDMVLFARARNNQTLKVVSFDGTTPYVGNTELTKDLAANNLVLEFLADVATAAETLTLDGFILEKS